MSILDHHTDKWRLKLDTGCYLWTGALSRGRSDTPSAGWNGKIVRVARIVCEEMYGPPPSSKHHAAHDTRNGCIGSLCVAPEHIRWATARENAADIPAKVRSDRIRRGAASMTFEVRKERAQKMLLARLAKETSESKREAALRGWATRRKIGCCNAPRTDLRTL